MNQFKALDNRNDEITNVIVNMFPLMYNRGEFFGDCGLNVIISHIEPKIRECIVEYIVKDYYDSNNSTQQINDITDKIKHELHDLFDVVIDKPFTDFINTFSSELTETSDSFISDIEIDDKVKLDELCKLYISIMLIKAKLNHLLNMLIRGCNVNLNVLVEGFSYFEQHRNNINDVIAEKYDDGVKHYVTLPVSLHRIPHAVLLVSERNDINGYNTNDRLYIVDLNDMSIIYDGPPNKYIFNENIINNKYECLSNNPTPIMAKRLAKIGLTKSGVETDFHEFDNAVKRSTKSFALFYRNYVDRGKCSYHNCRRFGVYYGSTVNIKELLRCKLEDNVFNIGQRIINDILNMIPEPFKHNILTTTKNLNIMNIFTVVVNKFIETFNSYNVNIPWECIITRVDDLDYYLLFFIVYYIGIVTNNHNILSYSDCFQCLSNDIDKYNIALSKSGSVLSKYKDIARKKFRYNVSGV